MLTDLSQLPMLLSFLPKGALRARYQLAVIAMVLHGCSGISCWRTTQYTAQLAELERDSASRLTDGWRVGAGAELVHRVGRQLAAGMR